MIRSSDQGNGADPAGSIRQKNAPPMLAFIGKNTAADLTLTRPICRPFV